MDKKETLLSKNLKLLRKANGYTQESLAKKLGIKRAAYATYEECRSEPRISIYNKICKLFKVSMDDCFNKELKLETKVVVIDRVGPIKTLNRE